MSTTPTPQNTLPASSRTAVPVKLATALALLLAVNTGVQLYALGERSAREAHAQVRSGETPAPFPNSAVRQSKIEDALIEANVRLGRIEAKLDKPLSVKVTEIVPITVSNLGALTPAKEEAAK